MPVSSTNTWRDFEECFRREVCCYGTFRTAKTSAVIGDGNGRNKYKRKCRLINGQRCSRSISQSMPFELPRSDAAAINGCHKPPSPR